MFEYFYNEILRKTIISFGTLFNGLEIQQKDSSDNTTVLSKFLLLMDLLKSSWHVSNKQSDLNKSTAMTLPRMSFEFTGLTYDPTRKVTTTQQFTVKDPTSESKHSKKLYASSI